MLGWIFFGWILFLWFVGFVGWYSANDILNSDRTIAPQMVGATLWFAEWGLWTPLVLTIVSFVLLVLSGLGAEARAERARQTWTSVGPATYSTVDPDVNFEPTPAERDMDRQVDDAFRRRG